MEGLIPKIQSKTATEVLFSKFLKSRRCLDSMQSDDCIIQLQESIDTIPPKEYDEKKRDEYYAVINQLIGYYNDPMFTKNAYRHCFGIDKNTIIDGILIGKSSSCYVIVEAVGGKNIISYATLVAPSIEELKQLEIDRIKEM
ncbi:MAG: hypothetical protein J6W37_05860 [Bacteroidales bacterium]|nr:hypothetical protein [Bacteroidales bacterium]